MYNTFVLVSG